MKISFLARWLPPRIDGVGGYTWNLACALRELGIEVNVFCSEEQASEGLVKKEWVFPVIRQWQPQAVIEALKAVTKHAPDWFCLQYVPQLYGRGGIAWQVPSILAALKREFPGNIAVTFHEFISGWGIGIKDIFLAGITRLQTRRILSRINLVVTTCARYKDILKRLSPNPLPITAIPVGANVEPISISAEKLRELRRRIFPDAAKVFGLFSRLSAPRNFPLAIKTLRQARQQGLNAWLYLIGNVESSNPKLFKEVMGLAEKLALKPYIVTTGELSKEDLSVRLKMLDLFIFPQIDGVSTRNTVLMAAMAHGLPVVSFKPQVGNFDNFYIPCGVLADRGDEEGFIQAAVECLKDSDNLRDAAFANRDYYYKNFSWTVIAKRYIEALEA